MLVHGDLQLACHVNFLLGKTIGFGIVFADLGAQQVLSRVRFMAAIGFDPFLNLGIAVFDHPDTLVVLPVFVGDFVLHEANLLGEVLNAVDPIIEY